MGENKLRLVKIQDTVTPDMRRKIALLKNKRPLLAVAGKGLEADLRAHFLEKNSQPNKMGWAKSNFWNQIRNATALKHYDDRQATVAVADPRLATHVYGATIRPKEARMLAIPVHPSAKGIMPKSGLIKGLFRPKGRWFLAILDANKKLRVMYALKKQVTVPKMPDALPPLARLKASTGRRITAWLDRNFHRRSAA